MRSVTLCSALALGVGACSNLPCDRQEDCPIGYTCSPVSSTCTFECLSASDCPQVAQPSLRRICSNRGQCTVAGRPPRVFIREPFEGQVYGPTQQSLQVSGRTETSAAEVRVRVESQGLGACSGRLVRERSFQNSEPGRPTDVLFLVDDIPLLPGPADVVVTVDAGLGRREEFIRVVSDCQDCPQVRIDRPTRRDPVVEPVLPVLSGRVDGAAGQAGFWRISDSNGQVFDGPLRLDASGRFELLRLPLFGGINDVQVRVPGPNADGRCGVSVLAPLDASEGLRAILTWDTADTDLDLVLVGPEGSLAEGRSLLSARFSQLPGVVRDDFDGFGPEFARTELADGVYGVAVEALTDGDEVGSTALVRILNDGRLLTVPPAGPRFLSARRGDVWLVGQVVVEQGEARFETVDRLESIRTVPQTAPAGW